MEDMTPCASQEDVLSSRATSTDGENPTSSPVLPPAKRQDGGRPRKAPTITPRSFTRFFTPKSSLERGGRIGASRQALRDITSSGSNRSGRRSPTKDFAKGLGEDIRRTDNLLGRRKRKTHDSLNTTPERSSPLKRIRNQSLEIPEDDDSGHGSGEELGYRSPIGSRQDRKIITITGPIVCSKYRGPQGRSLRREIGAYGTITKSRSFNHQLAGAKEWQYETTNFFTKPEDTYVCMNVAAQADNTIPFSIATCNSECGVCSLLASRANGEPIANSLVAIGDEDGGVRLLESAEDQKPGFTKSYLEFRPHTNAILDLAFSPDDLLLATASGDQSSHIIDMRTQRATYSLNGHVSSVKQVRFQPGGSNVIATSSRDGGVQIWDLRCKGFDSPVQDLRISLEPSAGESSSNPTNHKMTWARSVNSIFEAHASRLATSATVPSTNRMAPSFDAPSKTERPGRRGDVSITALSFLQPGREHLLITASEANASVKLWDLRTTHNHRRAHARPLSSTRQPESHNNYRHFGLTSLSLSDDGGRLYTLCRDNTIYAYSTQHLILGHAPELSKMTSKPRRSGGLEKEGLGPIYGFRHPKFHATTFYVKSALRPAKDDKSELLAVGSSDGCAVVFPTDERYMQRSDHLRTRPSDSPFITRRPALRRTGSGTNFPTRLEDTIPIYEHGSALVRGHSREVTGLAWTADGELVTVGDDFAARCWREGVEARDLRLGGEKEGRRWGCGWAEAEEGWDDDDV